MKKNQVSGVEEFHPGFTKKHTRVCCVCINMWFLVARCHHVDFLVVNRCGPLVASFWHLSLGPNCDSQYMSIPSVVCNFEVVTQTTSLIRNDSCDHVAHVMSLFVDTKLDIGHQLWPVFILGDFQPFQLFWGF